MQAKQHAGFTIIELMVSLLVFAVLVALAVPTFRDMMIKSRLRGATDDLVTLLNVARGSAVKLQRDVNVSVDIGNWCAGARAAGAPSAVAEPVPSATACTCGASTVDCKIGLETEIVSSGSYSGVTISSDAANTINSSQGGITFNSKFGALNLGSLPTSPAITVSADNSKYSTQISISQLGQAYVCRPTSSKFISGYPSC